MYLFRFPTCDREFYMPTNIGNLKIKDRYSLNIQLCLKFTKKYRTENVPHVGLQTKDRILCVFDYSCDDVLESFHSYTRT